MSILETVASSCRDVVVLREGGQRTVYRATHASYGTVVIKHLTYRSERSLERISREVRLLRDLTSPCLPTLHEFLVDPATREAITIESFIAGDELTVRKRDYVSEAAIVGLLRSLVACMRLPWANRVVHRDLKPSNILITPDGHPRIVDFGVARFLDDKSLTQSAAFMGPGTPIYAAPEQLQNRKPDVDVRTDFFALGIIALELHLGFHPFSPEAVGGESIPDNIVEGRYVDPSTKPGTSDAFAHLLRRLVQVEPHRRFRTPETLDSYMNQYWREDQ